MENQWVWLTFLTEHVPFCRTYNFRLMTLRETKKQTWFVYLQIPNLAAFNAVQIIAHISVSTAQCQNNNCRHSEELAGFFLHCQLVTKSDSSIRRQDSLTQLQKFLIFWQFEYRRDLERLLDGKWPNTKCCVLFVCRWITRHSVFWYCQFFGGM